MLSYLRWRHTRGYGVHSPFAYDVVKGVVSPGRYRYYGYDSIEGALADAPSASLRRQARMLLRLCAFASPQSVFVPAEAPVPFLTAVKAADSRILIEHRTPKAPECDLICSDAASLPLEVLLAYVALPGHTLALRNVPEEWREKLFGALGEGVMFYGKRNIIIFSRKYMQKVAYSISI